MTKEAEKEKNETANPPNKKTWSVKDTRLKILMSALGDIIKSDDAYAPQIASKTLTKVEKD